MKYTKIYLLHGRGGSPDGSMLELEKRLKLIYPQIVFIRPKLPHSDINSPPKLSVDFLRDMDMENGALVVGNSLGGLAAAKLQEESRPDLVVVCLCSPTKKDDLILNKMMENRFSIYSSNDQVVGDRVSDWPKLAKSFDVEWMNHDDFDENLDMTVKALTGLIETGNLQLDK